MLPSYQLFDASPLVQPVIELVLVASANAGAATPAAAPPWFLLVVRAPGRSNLVSSAQESIRTAVPVRRTSMMRTEGPARAARSRALGVRQGLTVVSTYTYVDPGAPSYPSSPK
ncbi:hypothetical protein NSI01_33720 [Pimelobacter simplex]|nr:hypothetical protein NSI01_33720 [Pimelobacter simplex]